MTQKQIKNDKYMNDNIIYHLQLLRHNVLFTRRENSLIHKSLTRPPSIIRLSTSESFGLNSCSISYRK